MRSSAWDLGLFVHAQHHRRLGRVQVQPGDVADLVHELRVGGHLVLVDEVGLEPERAPYLRHSRLRHPCCCGHRPRRPVRRVRRVRLQSAHEHVLDHRVGDLARRPRPRVVGQPVQAALREPAAPLRHRRRMTAQLRGEVVVRPPRRGAQHDPAPQNQRLGRLGPSRPPLQRLSLRVVELHRHRRPSPSSTHHSLRSTPKTP